MNGAGERIEMELAFPAPAADERELAVHPFTGEALDLLGAPDDSLARFLADLKDSERALRDAKRVVSDEVLRRMDTEKEWTLHAPGWELSAPSPEPEEVFDELALRNALLELADRGVISQAAVDRAVETVVDYKVRRAGVKALRKGGGPAADVVDAHCFKAERKRYVRVKRAGE